MLVGYSIGTWGWVEHNPQRCKCLDFNSKNTENQANALWSLGGWFFKEKHRIQCIRHAFIFLRLRRCGLNPFSIECRNIRKPYHRLLRRWNKSWRSNNPAIQQWKTYGIKRFLHCSTKLIEKRETNHKSWLGISFGRYHAHVQIVLAWQFKKWYSDVKDK